MVTNKTSTNHIRQIKSWFETAVPHPNKRNKFAQLGVHFEEVSEMLDALHASGDTFSSREILGFSRDVLTYLQRQLKDNQVELDVDNIDRVGLLDALCDQIVTAVGTAHMLGMDIEGALQEVANSNDSKFGPDGFPIFNAELKIMKGPGYQTPRLEPFAGAK